MGNTNPRVEAILDSATQWQAEMRALRAIVLDCGLTEEVKWRQACYTLDGGNVVIVSAFKDYCALSFFKGALLKDAKRLLVAPGQNTQSGRQLRFTSVREIAGLEPTVRAYVQEAIEVERAGLTVKLKETAEYAVPEELQTELDGDAAFRTAFEALTPGRQRAYILHFSQPKQSKTRTSRVEKSRQRILDGKGLNDR